MTRTKTWYTAAASPKRLRKAKVPVNATAIPAELRALRRWVVWDYIDYGEGKPRKVPVAPGKNHGLSWNVSTAWRDFDEVMREAAERGGLGVAGEERERGAVPHGHLVLHRVREAPAAACSSSRASITGLSTGAASSRRRAAVHAWTSVWT